MIPPLTDLPIALRTLWDEWIRTRWIDLQFAEARTALLVFIVILAPVSYTHLTLPTNREV